MSGGICGPGELQVASVCFCLVCEGRVWLQGCSVEVCVVWAVVCAVVSVGAS